MTLTVIIPTIGRPTLERTLDSVASQPLLDGDAVIVVGRGESIQAMAARYGYRFLECPPGGHGGAEERMKAIPLVTTTHIGFLDDDDVWVPGARETIRQAQLTTPTRPMVFRMRYPSGRELWKDKVVRRGNVGTPMIVVPNQPQYLGKWPSQRMNDYYFLSSMKWKPSDIVWRPDVLAVIRPC